VPPHARARAWTAGGDPEVELLIIDADATLVLANSDHKEGAAGTYKGTFGFAPLLPTWIVARRLVSPWRACCELAMPRPAPPMT